MTDGEKAHPTVPPEAWRPATRLADAIRRPIERFLQVEAAGGIILLVAAAIALIWANSGAPLQLGFKSCRFRWGSRLRRMFSSLNSVRMNVTRVCQSPRDIRRFYHGMILYARKIRNSFYSMTL